MAITAKRNSLSMDDYRRKLAGLEDTEIVDQGDRESFERCALALGDAMASLYNRDKLDPIKLWSRIASGLEQCARENAGDAEALVNGCLMHVLADVDHVAMHKGLAQLMEEVSQQSDNWSRQWSRWIVKRLHVVIVKTRARREAEKKNSNMNRKSTKTNRDASPDIAVNSESKEDGGLL